MRSALLGIILIVSLCNSMRSRRLRRQIIPSQHIQVHSDDSNILESNSLFVTVKSAESRIDMSERCVNGSLWSDRSILQFDMFDTFSNLTANNVESLFHVQDAILYGQGAESDFFMKSNRTMNGHSKLTQNLYGSANFSIDDRELRVQAVGGTRVRVNAQSWQRNVEHRMTLVAETLPTTERELRLEAVAPPYFIEVTFVGSMIYIQFADKVIKIEPTYKIIEIFTNKYTVSVQTNDSPYNVSLTAEEVVINLPNEKTRVCVNPAGVAVQVQHLAKTQIDTVGGAMNINNNDVQASGVKVTSLITDLDLNNEGHVSANTSNSYMIVHNALNQVGLTAAHHNLHIEGGVPHIVVEPGQACVEITANQGIPDFVNILPEFQPPVDKFVEFGPYQGTYHSNTAVNPAHSAPVIARVGPPAPIVRHEMLSGPPASLQAPIPSPPTQVEQGTIPSFGVPLPPNMLASGFAADVPQNSPGQNAIPVSPTSTQSSPVEASTKMSTTAEPISLSPGKHMDGLSFLDSLNDPIADLAELKKEMRRKKKMREWDETEVSHDRDGDEHVESFTFPNGTTVRRVIKTRRRITTTVVEHHKEEVNDTVPTLSNTNIPAGILPPPDVLPKTLPAEIAKYDITEHPNPQKNNPSPQNTHRRPQTSHSNPKPE